MCGFQGTRWGLLGLAGACWDRVHTNRQVWRVLCQSFKARRSKPFKRCPRLTVLGVYHTMSQLSRKIFSSLLTGTSYAPAALPPSVCFAVVPFGMIECYHTNGQLSTTFFKISKFLCLPADGSDGVRRRRLPLPSPAPACHSQPSSAPPAYGGK